MLIGKHLTAGLLITTRCYTALCNRGSSLCAYSTARLLTSMTFCGNELCRWAVHKDVSLHDTVMASGCSLTFHIGLATCGFRRRWKKMHCLAEAAMSPHQQEGKEAFKLQGLSNLDFYGQLTPVCESWSSGAADCGDCSAFPLKSKLICQVVAFVAFRVSFGLGVQVCVSVWVWGTYAKLEGEQSDLENVILFPSKI